MTRKSSRATVRGTVVLVTGGARGIGRATATAFAQAGALVAIGDLDTETVEKVAAEIEAATGGRVLGLRLDVTDAASFAAFMEAAEQQLGQIGVLVNNAGIMPTGVFIDESPAVTDRIMGINVNGVINGSRLAVERFVRNKRGTIVNVASLAGVSGFPGLATYCASKHAVLGFSEALYGEMREHGVQVVVVLPGIVRTELSAGAKIPGFMGPIATVDPEDVAAAIVDSIGRKRFRVTVPGRLGAMLTTMSLMPTPMRRWADRVTGTEAAYTQADPAIRARYHARVFGGDDK